MKAFLFLLFCLLFLNTAFSQNNMLDNYRGTIKVKKPGTPTKYIISKKTSLKPSAEMRVFRVRSFNYTFNEYFPKDYNSEYFPLMLNYGGLMLVDEKRKYVGAEILNFEYTVVKSNVTYLSGFADLTNQNYCFRQISKMTTGSCVWIKKLVYKDKNGVIHKNEIGEFKVVKVS